MATRDITITVKLNSKDNEILEIVAGVLGQTPDQVLHTVLSGVADHVQVTLRKLEQEIIKQWPEEVRLAYVARGVVNEAVNKIFNARMRK